MKYLFILLTIFLFAVGVFAKEPQWTDAERVVNRDIVIQGEVQYIDIEKKYDIDKYNADLYLAKINVIEVYKGDPELKGQILDVYYEFSEKSIRCPKYVELKQGDSGKFFIRKCDEELKKRIKMQESPNVVLFIEMGSDVQLEEKMQINVSNEPSVKLPEALNLAQKYIDENNIDISKHYLDNIRLLFNSPWMEGKHWIITWKLKTPSIGGEIFIFVGMDKKIKIQKGI